MPKKGYKQTEGGNIDEPPLKESKQIKGLEQKNAVSDNPNKPNPCGRQSDMGLHNYWRHAIGVLPNCGGICTVICRRLR